jgi:catechol 2,3-dioxygenase-like lactoylglutathione lyase family enzyme
MKRFHVHVSVKDLNESIRFYSTLFGAPPSVEKPDYAKWMMEDPRVNFAISTRDPKHGVNHLGLQVESEEELTGLEAQLKAADRAMIVEANATCCYANSQKYWVTDPQGVAWETFRTLGNAPVYGESPLSVGQKTECCAPPAAVRPVEAPKATSNCGCASAG